MVSRSTSKPRTRSRPNARSKPKTRSISKSKTSKSKTSKPYTRSKPNTRSCTPPIGTRIITLSPVKNLETQFSLLAMLQIFNAKVNNIRFNNSKMNELLDKELIIFLCHGQCADDALWNQWSHSNLIPSGRDSYIILNLFGTYGSDYCNEGSSSWFNYKIQEGLDWTEYKNAGKAQNLQEYMVRSKLDEKGDNSLKLTLKSIQYIMMALNELNKKSVWIGSSQGAAVCMSAALNLSKELRPLSVFAHHMAGIYGTLNKNSDEKVKIIESDTNYTNIRNTAQFESNHYHKHSVWLHEEKKLLWRIIVSAIRGHGVYTIVLSKRDEVVHPNLSNILLKHRHSLFEKRNIYEIPNVLPQFSSTPFNSTFLRFIK